MRDNVAELLRLMLVTDDALVQGRDLVQLALAAERGVISSLQLRLKQRPARDLVELLRVLVQALTVPVLLNDRPDVALAGGAAGVHLGPGDVSVALVRRIAPPGFLLGSSVGSPDEAGPAKEADYWGIGPWRATQTKGDAGIGLGSDGFRALLALAENTPCLAIGGIRPEDVPLVRALGGSGVAVVSGILGTNDVEAAARVYRDAGQ